MKGVIGMLFFSMLLTACGDKTVFMDGHKVVSGDYYLTLVVGNDLLLIDNPELLQKYQQHIRVRKATDEKLCKNPMEAVAFSLLCAIPYHKEDYSLKLMHKKKGLVRELRYGETYDIPDELYRSAKRVGATEAWDSVDNFLRRKKHLEQIKGVRILSADTLPYSHLVNIYFPLRIEKMAEDFGESTFKEDELAKTIKKSLQERLFQTMAQHDITDYKLIKLQHESIHQPIINRREERGSYGIPAVYNWMELLDKNPRAEDIAVMGYRGDLFAMQINCNADGAEAIERSQPLDWLPSPLSQEWLLAELKTVIEAQGLTFHSERTIDVRFDSLPTHYLPDSAKAPRDYLMGTFAIYKRRMDLPEHLMLQWLYDKERALNYPYPQALAAPPEM